MQGAREAPAEVDAPMAFETKLVAAMLVAVGASAVAAEAQVRVLVPDRSNGKVWLLADRDNSGMIDQPNEVTLFFGPNNAAGTPFPRNPRSIAVRPDGLVLIGDADPTSRRIIWLKDLNGDGDAMGAGESGVFLDTTNASGVPISYPNGISFDGIGRAIATNFGTAIGPNAILRLQASSATPSANGPSQAAVLVPPTLLGPGNGASAPQKTFVHPNGTVFLRDSVSGVFRFVAGNAGGPVTADEFRPFWTPLARGVRPASGFSVAPDPVRPNAVYAVQTAGIGVAQLVRLQDLDGNLDAQSANESRVVWSSLEENFTSVDLATTPEGRVLISDSTGLRVIMLVDSNGDGRFDDFTERTEWFVAGRDGVGSGVGSVWAFAVLPPVQTGCVVDFNNDGLVNTDDLSDYITCFFSVPSCTRADINSDGQVNTDDLTDFITQYFNRGPGCP